MSRAADTSSALQSRDDEIDRTLITTMLDSIGTAARTWLLDFQPRIQIASRTELESAIAHLDTELEQLKQDELTLVQVSECGTDARVQHEYEYECD
jgi:hypothetical protein